MVGITVPVSAAANTSVEITNEMFEELKEEIQELKKEIKILTEFRFMKKFPHRVLCERVYRGEAFAN
jgi:hypothetical protein